MVIKRKSTRYAHSDGHTDVCYSEDGSKIITCGTDGDIRVWSGFDDDDPVQRCVGEWSLCVRQKGNQLHVATDNNNIQIMTFPEAERDGILTRFTAHVNHMAVGKSHNFIAIAAEDMDVKIMDLSNKDNNIINFNGVTGPPLGVALCPNAKLLAVSSGDGQLRIWDVANQSILKQFDCVSKTNSFMNAKLLCRIDFDPIMGRTLAYPDKNTVVIVNTSDWAVKLTLKCSKVDASYSIVQYSPCGNYLAASSEQGDLVVWEVATQTLVDATKHVRSLALSGMVWNPSGNGEIAFCDVEGQLGIATDCTSVIEPQAEVPNDGSKTNEVDFSGFQFEDDDDEDNENAISIEKLKNEIMGTEEPELDFDKESSSHAPTPRPRTPEIPLQPTFMPTSTPEHLNPRYLCWNDIGIVRCYGSENENDAEGNRTIEVEFHDASMHNSMMMQNYQGYTMGSLSASALVVANTSQITVVPLGSSAKDWNLTVAEEEEIVAVACSDKLICFATANYMVHVCTIYGVQKAVFCVPGPLVSINAHGCFVLVAYHSGTTRKGDQCIDMLLVKLEGTSVESKNINSALKPESTLQYVGFTDIGTPAIQDSTGMLYLYPVRSNIWMPFCDTSKHTKNPLDGFFVTAVFESFQAVRGIRCRGSVYPSFTPRPTLIELPLEPTFAELTTEKAELESNLFTWSTLQVENMDKKYKETALKSFALACKNNLDQRALELIEMISNPQLLTLAMKYASKLDKRRLTEKLMELASKIQETEDSEPDCSQNDNYISTPPIRPMSTKIFLKSMSKRTPKTKDEKSQAPTTTTQNESSTSTKQDSSLNANNSINNSSLSTQDLSILENEPKNPFLKNRKEPQPKVYNPLSLTDKFAGYDQEKAEKKEKENKNSVNGLSSEKRKKPDTEGDKQKGKHRKLDQFLFAKRS